jgi:hypothetical protein
MFERERRKYHEYNPANAEFIAVDKRCAEQHWHADYDQRYPDLLISRLGDRIHLQSTP